MSLDIRIEKTKAPKAKPDPHSLGFGRIFSDHMFLMNYSSKEGWHDARIVPYGPLALDPSSMVFHYAQEVFEGMKTYKTKDGKVLLFRPDKNIARMNRSLDRLCMPAVPEDDFLQALLELIKVEKDWIPEGDDTSLYIRPFMIATDPFIGVKPSDTYLFAIILSPVGAYYPEGINPVKIFIETEYVRAVRGGLGFTKAGANYAASIKSQVKAHDLGYTQVLWLDGVERKYIDEVGTMNVFFKIDGKVVTPFLEGSVLPGVTRDSVINVLRDKGFTVEERRVSVDELCEAHKNGKLEEAFGTGTAAVISPVGEINYEGNKMIINDFKIGPTAQMLYNEITGIQTGKIPDRFGWTVEVK